MGLLRVLLVRAAEADVRADRDDRRALVGPRRRDGRLDLVEVVAVLDPRRVPAVRLVALGDVLRPGHRRRPVELDVVVVVQHDELAEPQVPRQRRHLRRDALLEVAVGRDDVRPVVDDVVPVAVELGRQATLGDGHPDRVRQPLPERPGRRLDARRQPRLRVARRLRPPLPERLELRQRQVVAGEVEQRVEQHRGVPSRQHEPVAVGPVGVTRGVAQEPRPQHVRHRRGAHRGARDARSSPVARHRSTACGSCRWRVGRCRSSRRPWAIVGRCGRYARTMPSLRPTGARRSTGRIRVVVVGDLVVDVVLRPDRPLEHGSDVPGQRVPRPGRLGRDRRPLARSPRGTLIADRRGRSRCRGPGPGRRHQGGRGHAARGPHRRCADRAGSA